MRKREKEKHKNASQLTISSRKNLTWDWRRAVLKARLEIIQEVCLTTPFKKGQQPPWNSYSYICL